MNASHEEIAATVMRMEARLSTSPQPLVELLFRLYEPLAKRFETDLAGSARDVVLAKASALMLVQAASHIDGHAASHVGV